MQISRLQGARADLQAGLFKPSIWWGLAWLDIKQRYRRSLLGPFWITTSTGVLVAAMGPLYGRLLGQNTSSYLPYLAVSLILWSYISSPINEAGSAFVNAESYIRQIPLPLSIYVFRLLAKNALILAHNTAIILVVYLFIPPDGYGNLWLLPFGLLILTGNLLWLTFLLAVAGSRFRDIPQLVSNVVQLAFFVTPVLWKADMLDARARSFIDFNPLFHLLEIVREPLLGTPLNPTSWTVAIALLVTGSLATFAAFARLRSRIPYWL